MDLSLSRTGGLLLEAITPPSTWGPERIAGWVEAVADLAGRHGIRHLNLPEVVDEPRGGRTVPYVHKMDNTAFAARLREKAPGIAPLLNKISVRLARPEFEEWVARVHGDGIRHLLIVGAPDDNPYTGYSVPEGVRFIKRAFPDMAVGGISIFTRPGESKRILDKIEGGVDFFVTQIVFETANMKQVLGQLAKAGRTPDFYVSVAHVARRKDIEFLRWLGVEFPSAVLAYLDEGDERVAERSHEVVERVVWEITEFARAARLPIGFNVEHVMYSNLPLAEELIRSVRRAAS